MKLLERLELKIEQNNIKKGEYNIPDNVELTSGETLQTVLEKYGYSEVSNTYRKELFKRYSMDEINQFNADIKTKPRRMYHNHQKTQLSGFKDYTIHHYKIGTYPCMTLSGNEGCILLEDELKTDAKIVKLSVNAREALQGYPKDYTRYGVDEKGKKVEISKTNRIKMCGNGVSSIIPKTILTTFLKNNEYKCLSLCSGLGGMELMLPENFKINAFCEFGKHQSQVLKYHHPDIVNYGDLTKIDPQQLEDCDLLLAGFPCQAYSQNGKRKGLEDPRGKIIYNIFDIIKCKKPKYILAENVKGLLTHDKGETFISILKGLNECGYTVNYKLLNSSNFGLAQERERVYIFCERM